VRAQARGGRAAPLLEGHGPPASDGSITRAAPSAALLGPSAPSLPLNRAPIPLMRLTETADGGTVAEVAIPFQRAPGVA
jgi:hypothetical protein